MFCDNDALLGRKRRKTKGLACPVPLAWPDHARAFCPDLAGFGVGFGFGKAASRAKRNSFNRAVFSRMAVWLAWYSAQAAAPALSCASFRKCRSARRAATVCGSLSFIPWSVGELNEKAPRAGAPDARLRLTPQLELCQYIRGQSAR